MSPAESATIALRLVGPSEHALEGKGATVSDFEVEVAAPAPAERTSAPRGRRSGRPDGRLATLLDLQQSAGNAAVVRLLARQGFVKPPPTPEEKAAGEAGVRADAARHAPLVRAARGKFDRKAAELVGGAKPNWAKLKLDKVPEDVTKKEAPKFATITEEDVREAFMNAWSSIFAGQPIPGKVLARLVGQWKAEGGKTGIADFNIGNITYPTEGERGPPKDPKSDYRKRTAGEAQPSGEKVPKTAFYAVFENLEQGAMGLLHRIIVGPNGGLPLLAALIYGTREEYVLVAKSYKYFTGPIRNVVITDRDGQRKIWWSGYLDSMAPVPEVDVPPTPPPMPQAAVPEGEPVHPEQPPVGPPAPPPSAPASGPPPEPVPAGPPEPEPRNPFEGQQEGGMSGDTGTD